MQSIAIEQRLKCRTYSKHGPQVHGRPLWTRAMDHFMDHPTFEEATHKKWPEVSERMFKLQSFGFAGRRVIDLKYIYYSNAGICGADLPDSSDR